MQWDDNQPARYQSAAICRKGHVLTANREEHPTAKFCAECGAPVLTACPGCSEKIRGHFVPPGATSVSGPFDPPNYCFACGEPFPWMIEKLDAAQDLADELEEMTPDDRAKLKVALNEVASNGPRAEVGAARIKRMLAKASTGIGQALWKIAVEIASEAAKKVLLEP